MRRKTETLIASLDPRRTVLFAGNDVTSRLPRFNERWHRVALHMKIQHLQQQGYEVLVAETCSVFGRMALAELARLRPGSPFQLWSLRLAGDPEPDEAGLRAASHPLWEQRRASLRCDRRLGELSAEVYEKLLHRVGVVVTPAETFEPFEQAVGAPAPEACTDLAEPGGG